MKKKKNIITIVLLLVVVIGGFFFFRKGSSPAATLTTQSATGATSTVPGQAPVGNDLLVLLLRLKSLTLNDEIFSDQTFISLHDFGQQLVDQPKGRRNPFAPIGVGEAVSSTPSGSQPNVSIQTAPPIVSATSTRPGAHN